MHLLFKDMAHRADLIQSTKTYPTSGQTAKKSLTRTVVKNSLAGKPAVSSFGKKRPSIFAALTVATNTSAQKRMSQQIMRKKRCQKQLNQIFVASKFSYPVDWKRFASLIIFFKTEIIHLNHLISFPLGL